MKRVVQPFILFLFFLLTTTAGCQTEVKVEEIAHPPYVPISKEQEEIWKTVDDIDKNQSEDSSTLFSTSQQFLAPENELIAIAQKSGIFEEGYNPDNFHGKDPINPHELLAWINTYTRAGELVEVTTTPINNENKNSNQEGTTPQAANNADNSKPNTADPSEPKSNSNSGTKPETPKKKKPGFVLPPLTSTDNTVNRQDLCRIYVLLVGRHTDVMRMTPEDIETFKPSGSTSLTHEFSNTFDYPYIEPQMKPYVAFAYGKHIIRDIFGISPQDMINGTSLEPEEAVTRKQALSFLIRLYGE